MLYVTARKNGAGGGRSLQIGTPVHWLQDTAAASSAAIPAPRSELVRKSSTAFRAVSGRSNACGERSRRVTADGVPSGTAV